MTTKEKEKEIVALELAVSGATTVRAQCPHCQGKLVIRGDHPPAKIEVFAVEMAEGLGK